MEELIASAKAHHITITHIEPSRTLEFYVRPPGKPESLLAFKDAADAYFSSPRARKLQNASVRLEKGLFDDAECLRVRCAQNKPALDAGRALVNSFDSRGISVIRQKG
ncbi:MAG: hypothetical protein Q8P02_03475 [Candidatus Micrarchaeota archaeon]|nr:hypothetical protein [Candidatus Micrarchaeota archaeon]